LPTLTYSAHAIREPAFLRARGQYIDSEKALLARVMKEYATHDL
jgi:predicted N-acyltransferase